MSEPRVTELSNHITRDLDAHSIEGMLKLLRQSDSQLFKGFDTMPALSDASMIRAMKTVASIASELIAVGICEYACVHIYL
jgi:hypothetical protein